jgi:GxxExxY protein
MTELLEKELVYKIIGCAMSVHNAIGPGLREKTYENALCVEFRYQGIGYSQQKRYPVQHREEQVDEFVPDLIVEDKVIVDTKTVEAILDDHRGTKLVWERLVLDVG